MDVAERLDSGTRPHARGLMLAVLESEDTALADRMLTEATALGVDPFDYCAHRLKLGDHEVLKRAAHWAGFGFSEVVPRNLPGRPSIQRLDHLAEVRTLRTTLFDRGVTFVAPRFEELMRLAMARLSNPDLARHVCIVTARALRERLGDVCGPDLLTEARQRLTRRWPFASADVDLPRTVRIAFVLLFAFATAAVAAAPFYLGAVLLPFVAILLLVPASIRLAAAFGPREAPEPIWPLNDAALPVYSVLIPLRDEAAMVPLLRRAMEAIDYPALCSKLNSARALYAPLMTAWAGGAMLSHASAIVALFAAISL